MAIGMEWYLVQVVKDIKTRKAYVGLACIFTTIVMQASPLFTVVCVFSFLILNLSGW
jgi:hypothetical protein